MSQPIADIQVFHQDRTSPTILGVNSFFGGQAHGRCVQLTLPFGINYGQLTRRAVWELHASLGEWLRNGDKTKGI